MVETTQQPIISLPDSDDELDFGGTKAFHRAKSDDTDGAFSVVELVSEPGNGAALHVHENEDELVYVAQGEIEVTLGDQTMRASKGVLALLPRGIPHGYTNTGAIPSRLLVVILPGNFDRYIVESHNLSLDGEPDPERVEELAREFGIRYL